jgi:hypothetical protein
MVRAWNWNDEEQYDEFTIQPPTVRDLLDYLTQYLDYSAGNEGREQISHHSPFDIGIYDEDGEYYVLTGAELRRHGGCGCEAGISLHIRKN